MKKLIAIALLTTSGVAFAGNCDYSWQRDSRGGLCGGRSAESRPGGYEPSGSSRSWGGNNYVAPSYGGSNRLSPRPTLSPYGSSSRSGNYNLLGR